jgi:endonuclease/exonuclease/phosphatase (EEP) superfamily protein YafD
VFGSTIAPATRVREVGGSMLQQLLVYGLAAVSIAATAMPFHKDETWWVRATDFPRTQVAVLIVITLAAVAALFEITWFDWALALVLLVCLGAQLAVILPYTRLWPVQVRAADGPAATRTLSLMVVNVLMDNRGVDRLATLIGSKDPDLVLAVETDAWWTTRLQDALPSHSFKVAHPLSNTYGMILLSRLELIDPQVRFLLKPDIPSILTDVRLRSGDVVTLYGLHPEPPAPGEADTSLPRDAELVLAGREVGEGGGATIVAGDFNDVAWSHTSRLFRRISHLLDPRIGRGMYNTFHARYPVLRWPLDHVFVSDEILLRRMERLPGFGSDHFPIYIALDHAPAAGAVQEAPSPDAEDRAEARDKLMRADVVVQADHRATSEASGIEARAEAAIV